MKEPLLAAGLMLCAAACVSGPAPPDPQQTAINVVSAPFVVAFKIPVCAVTVALAAPLGGVATLSPTPDSWALRADLDQGVRQNCGPYFGH
jgi:hypothetical protein